MQVPVSPRSDSPCPPISVLSPPSPLGAVERNPGVDGVYDLVGIGFGPANLALAIALRESPEAQEGEMRFSFVEKQPAFSWHSSLLLPGSQLQVSPLKDLATLRDPTSSYTFYNYLHQQGRLAAFINRDAATPSRREWSAYLTWAAKRMDKVVSYNQEVVSVEPEQRGAEELDPLSTTARVQHLRVTTRDMVSGEETVRIARNITVGVGGVPRLPLPFHHVYQPYRFGKAQQIAHSCTYLPSLAALEPMLRVREAERLAALSQQQQQGQQTLLSSSSSPMRTAPLRFAVIGSGQSSAEISLHLRKTFPNSLVKLIFRSSALVPSDDSAFVNGAAFDPERTDVFWKANEHDRKAWTDEYRRTNYSVVRSDVINEIHTNIYDQQIEFDQPWPNADGPSVHGWMDLMPNTQVNRVEMEKESGRVRLEMESTKLLESNKVESFDAVFLGTGFERRPSAMKFLNPVSQFFPLLDEKSTERKAALGFVNEEETNGSIGQLMESSDEDAVEKLRHRTRGIARDYRLISYWSDAFSHPFASTGNTPPSRGGSSGGSRNNSPGRRASATSSSHSSSATLAGNAETGSSGSLFEPSIYFMGGNELTHGLSDSLLSIVAHRAGEMSESVVKSRPMYSSKSSTGAQDMQSDLKSSLQSVLTAGNKAAVLDDIAGEKLHKSMQKMQVA